ncbi:MAG: hypothetical protein SH809_11135 [Rhodothermales bacterium]|nr:hypothetical protein [Rhodothermales bacterium]
MHNTLLRAGLVVALLASSSTLAFAQSEPIALFVGNQGNFSDANGTVTVIDPNTLGATQDAVPNLNTLVQSIALHKGTAYVMANTSDRIDLFDVDSRERTGQIAGVPSPRYLRVVGADKAYVSNLFDATVTIIRLSDASVQGTIPVGDNPEAIAVAGGRVYVANHGFGAGTTLTVIDPLTDVVVETVTPGCDGPRMLEGDLEGDLWVMCTGNTVYNDDFTEIISQSNGRVVVLAGGTGDVVASFDATSQLGTGIGGQDVYYDAVSRRFLVIEGMSLLAFDTASNVSLPTVSIPGSEALGAVAYDDVTSRFFVGRLNGFTEAGFVSVHDTQGREVGRAAAGIAPSSIALWTGGSPVATESPEIPRPFALSPGYPNPFRGAVAIGFQVDVPASVRLAVYNLLGERVAVLAEGVYPAGAHEVRWAPGLSSAGVYISRLEVEGVSVSRPLTYVR